MSAKDKPISKPMNKQFADNYDRIFNVKSQIPAWERNRVKDRVDLGLSPSTSVSEMDCTKKTMIDKEQQDNEN